MLRVIRGQHQEVEDKINMERLMHNARKYAGEMLQDRGYNIALNVSDVPLQDFKLRLANNDIDLFAKHATHPTQQIYVKFQNPLTSKKLSPSLLEKETAAVVTKLTEPENTIIILVVQDALQSNVQLLLKQSKYTNVEVFTYNSLQFNPTKHCLVPKHEVVPKEEESGVLQQVNIQRKNLNKEMQKIMSSDHSSQMAWDEDRTNLSNHTN